MTKIIELILTDYLQGTGKENDPVRRVLQLWTKDGKLLVNGTISYLENNIFD